MAERLTDMAKDGLSRHNYLLDFLKVFFALEIALMHFHHGGEDVFATTDFFVNFFFVISGFYLSRGFFSNRYPSAGRYTLHRLERLMPAYLLAFLLLFAFKLATNPPASLGKLLNTVLDRIPEVFLVQNLGIFDGGINYPLWYVCVLVFVSHIVFALLKHNKNLTLNVIGPLVIVLIGTYRFNVYGTHDVMVFSVEAHFFYEPLLRGFLFVFLGTCCYRPITKVVAYLNRIKHSGMLTTVVSVLCLICLWRSDHSANYLVFLVLIACSSTPSMLLNRLFAKGGAPASALSRMMGDLSLHIYFNQALIIRIFALFSGVWAEWSQLKLLGAFVVVLVLESLVTIAITKQLERKLMPRLKRPLNEDQASA